MVRTSGETPQPQTGTSAALLKSEPRCVGTPDALSSLRSKPASKATTRASKATTCSCMSRKRFSSAFSLPPQTDPGKSLRRKMFVTSRPNAVPRVHRVWVRCTGSPLHDPVTLSLADSKDDVHCGCGEWLHPEHGRRGPFGSGDEQAGGPAHGHHAGQGGRVRLDRLHHDLQEGASRSRVPHICRPTRSHACLTHPVLCCRVQDGKTISPWHDIPLEAGDGMYNFVCEIPKMTLKKMEVRPYHALLSTAAVPGIAAVALGCHARMLPLGRSRPRSRATRSCRTRRRARRACTTAPSSGTTAACRRRGRTRTSRATPTWAVPSATTTRSTWWRLAPRRRRWAPSCRSSRSACSR